VCFIAFVTNLGVKIYQMIWFQVESIVFIFGINSKFNIVYPAEMAPLETEIDPQI